MDPKLNERLGKLKDQFVETWRTDFIKISSVVCHLNDGGWHTITDLIQEHAISHKTVSHLITLLTPWLEVEKDRFRLRTRYIDAVNGVFRCENASPEPPIDPYETTARAATALSESMTEVLNGLPREDFDLDQVSALPFTSVKRALFLAQNYDLGETKILFLGDHDLTSIALAHLHPAAKFTVVDVQESLLAYINALSIQNGWNIRTVFADLRLELPQSLKEQFDLVFTDPPYTPKGVKLFLGRGIESLKRSTFSRILLCYGFSERHPMLGYKVQREIFRSRLVIEAILPHFNRYRRAQAIGSSSDLYLCRPAQKRAWELVSPSATTDPLIYTHGKASEEASTENVPPELLAETRQLLKDNPGKALTCVGRGWPKELLEKQLSIRQYIKDTIDRGGKPPFTRPPYTDLVAVNLYPHYGPYLIRILMVAEAAHLLIATTEDAFEASGIDSTGNAIRTIVESKYRLVKIRRARNQSLLITASKTSLPESDPVKYVLNYLFEHQRALIQNGLREGFISWFGKKSRTITKNQARKAIKKSTFYKLHAGSYLTELPIAALKLLVEEIEHTLSELSELAA